MPTIQYDTQLIIIEDWSSMALAFAKNFVIQGGAVVKHKEPRPLLNNSPYYITTTDLPAFGNENHHVYRRTQVFRNRSLPSPPGADQRIYDHAMDCIAWMANVINENIQLIEQEERWYEGTSGNNLGPMTMVLFTPPPLY